MDTIVENDEIKIMRFELGQWSTNAYIVVCQRTNQSCIIDAPAGAEEIADNLRDTSPKYILLTHSHLDHIGGLQVLQERIGSPLMVHKSDSHGLTYHPQKVISGDDTFTVGNLQIRALHTPGHTPGSTCFLIDQYLLAGDTIFPGGPGWTDSPASFKLIVRSITGKIFTLSDETKIYPGHGVSTFVKKEKDEFCAFARRPHNDKLCGDVIWLTAD